MLMTTMANTPISGMTVTARLSQGRSAGGRSSSHQ